MSPSTPRLPCSSVYWVNDAAIRWNDFPQLSGGVCADIVNAISNTPNSLTAPLSINAASTNGRNTNETTLLDVLAGVFRPMSAKELQVLQQARPPACAARSVPQAKAATASANYGGYSDDECW